MLVTVYQTEWMTAVPFDAIRTDPTRMAQGIMTGIGFLGAGVARQLELDQPEQRQDRKRGGRAQDRPDRRLIRLPQRRPGLK